ncbi:MAG: hypothetical protein [Bacteriophage sp.]|nr:MAG: hypothetical protein [Bacteriophage sp.]
MINVAVIVGRLTQDPELRTTQSGISVCQFTVAVNRPKSKDSEVQNTDFISCTIWQKGAENFVAFAKKGSLVGIKGRTYTGNYVNQNNVTVYYQRIQVETFQMLEPKGTNSGIQSSGTNYSKTETNTSYSTGSQNTQQSNSAWKKDTSMSDPFAGSGDTIDISDDDLPF